MDISLPYSFSTLLCYSVLYLAVACLWLPASIWGQPLWLILAASAGFIALISGQLTPLGLGLAALYLFIAYLFSRTTGAKKKWLTLLLAALSVLFGAHLLPGFHNLQALNAVLVSADGLPFTMYLNLDKTLVALGLLGWCIPRLSRRQEWRQLLQVLLSRSLLFLLLIFILALASGKVHWDPKLPSCTLLWMLTNLLFVCTAEEAFFRGFLQQQLALLWKNRPLQQELPLALASLVYGLSHFAGGPLYVAFVTLAGLGYGWVYQKTGCIEASILLHFALNAAHFLLFTYPSLP
ncbi:MAG: CPBP family intramembrane glutamic endopeptidase [Anaeromusa sp.]|uniref:CPBP family intramembrane glutamic endopeptidase n=1 Tax=Anaeromusa sp. TaxID=1872520 RepID=UPI002B21AB62|nr:CPBP family intramembrane glutamic endopeptidase [Anaeromusa sp.]MEA4834695.1 CPBP family intramembrane glutamic endopeptidase [Anaeromusa sp.]